jgi:hypothetical protein
MKEYKNNPRRPKCIPTLKALGNLIFYFTFYQMSVASSFSPLIASLRTVVVNERCSIEIAWQKPMLSFANTGGMLNKSPNQDDGFSLT